MPSLKSNRDNYRERNEVAIILQHEYASKRLLYQRRASGRHLRCFLICFRTFVVFALRMKCIVLTNIFVSRDASPGYVPSTPTQLKNAWMCVRSQRRCAWEFPGTLICQVAMATAIPSPMSRPRTSARRPYAHLHPTLLLWLTCRRSILHARATLQSRHPTELSSMSLATTTAPTMISFRYMLRTWTHAPMHAQRSTTRP